jgi:uncharacterized protein
MFKEERQEPSFTWDMIGDIAVGRPNLGRTTDLAVYRLMQFTLHDVLIAELGVMRANLVMYKAGKVAGTHFCRNLIATRDDLGGFVAELQQKLKELNVGILRMEKADPDKLQFVMSVSEDLDCSGLPDTGEVICSYDEGFIAGILQEYSGREFEVREIDCWCNGDRTCRFQANVR